MSTGIVQMRRAAEELQKLKARAQNIKKEAEEVATQVFATIEAAAGGALSGFISVHYGDKKPLGVPIDLWGAAGLKAAAFFDIFGKETSHVHNVANGVIAGITARYATGWATQHKGALHAGAISAGQLAGGFVGPRAVINAESRFAHQVQHAAGIPAAA